jgi:RNA polymerase sigma-70 factor (ECF subfamily)
MSPESEKRKIAEFFSREYAGMVAYVRRLIDDAGSADGEDIVQDVMERLFTLADVTAPVEKLAAYVYRALRNRVIDALRSRKDELSLDASVTRNGDASLGDFLRDGRYDAAEETEKRELRERLFAAIDSLGEEQRAVVFMTEFEGRSFRELSEELGIPIGTLLARKSRAMKKVRETLEGSHTEMEEHNGN